MRRSCANKRMKLSESLTDGGDGWTVGRGVAITHMLRWIIPSFVRCTMRARGAGLKKDRHTVSSQQPWRDGSRARGIAAKRETWNYSGSPRVLERSTSVSVGFKEETLLNVTLESRWNFTEDPRLDLYDFFKKISLIILTCGSDFWESGVQVIFGCDFEVVEELH